MVVNIKSNDVLVPGGVVGIYQEGGQVMEGEPEMSQDPMEILVQMASAGIKGDCESATKACAMILEMIQQQMGAEEAPMEEAPMEEPV